MSAPPAVDLKSLHPLEVKVLRWAASRTGIALRAEDIIAQLGFNVGQCNQALSWLAAKGLTRETERRHRTIYEPTELALEYRVAGTPDERILRLLNETDSLGLPEIAEALGLENREVGSAFGRMSKEGLVEMDELKQAHAAGVEPSVRILTVRALIDRSCSDGAVDEASLSESERGVMSDISKKRGAASSLFRTVEREDVLYTLTTAGAEAARGLGEAGLTGDEIGVLTQELLASGKWKSAARDSGFRRYSMATPPARVQVGRGNPYVDYIRWVKDKFVSLGFEEFDGPLVETEFWNGDALYMPQFHAARDIHDVYSIKHPERAREIEAPWLDRVARAHEDGGETGSRGWGYPFDRDFTRKLILRSQGTVLSAKQLPKAKIPGRYFGIVRCFRYDQVDATHGADFYQTEGIVLGKDVNLRTLLGLLKMFAEEVAGASEVKYVPAYFPFTEPSIEVHIRHPELGWFELGGSGIFRPEVSRSLGVEVPVLARGLGIDRMAIMKLGLSDLRELFTPDIESVRLRRRG